MGSAHVLMPRMPLGAMTRWSSWMQAVALWARSMYVQAKAWVMLSEETPLNCVSVGVEFVGTSEVRDGIGRWIRHALRLVNGKSGYSAG